VGGAVSAAADGRNHGNRPFRERGIGARALLAPVSY